MNTESLIEALSKDVKPVRKYAVGRRLTLGILSGGAVTLALVAFC